MSLSTLGNIVLILILIAWFGYRQSTWRPVEVARMVRIPVILGIVGVLQLGGQAASLGSPEIGVIAVEVVISLAVGAWMGAIAHLRPVVAPDDRPLASSAGRSLRPLGPADGGGAAPTWESRTGLPGLILWVLVVALRIGIDVAGAHLGLLITASTGVILLTLAANRLGRVAVLAARVDRAGQARRMMVP